uniref:trypsin n=1 Tax=Kryptolebias marmoratus TaxID=37003 RepID=A0A3Q3G9C7_KRYMA
MIQTSRIVCMALLFTLTGSTENGIVGGRVAKPHSRPYMASLQIEGQHSCGGVLIQNKFVLTAAHCRKTQDPEITVVLGAHDISQAEDSQQKIQVEKYHKHPKYTGGFDYDIMLLELQKKIEKSKYVRKIELPGEDEKIPANVACDVAGWGQTGPQNPASNLLRETKEKTQFPCECKNLWREHFNSEHMMCTQSKGGVCQGDSGGPLICDAKLHGITAYTAEDKCENQRFPHVFTNVRSFLPWIKKP